MRLISTLCLLLAFSMAWSQALPIISGSKEMTYCGVKKITAAELIRSEPHILKDALDGKLPEVVKVINCWGKPLPTPKVIGLQNNLTGKVSGVNVQKKDSVIFGSIRIRCNGRRNLTGDSQPLLVVDGVQTELKFLSEINPKDIISVEIIKSAAATALFGSEGVNGVIFIETKKSVERKFIIKDFLDGSRVSGATVSFITADKKDTLMLATNDSGVIFTDKLKRSVSYEMVISAVGYQSIGQQFNNKYGYWQQNILLTRDIKNCDEVVLANTYCPQKIGCTLYCRISGITIFNIAEKKEQVKREPVKLSIYPNPTQKGGTVNLQLNNNEGNNTAVRIVSMNGREMLQQTLQTNKGKNHFQLSTDARWAAGTYFIQVIYENGRILASEKIIIQ